jgi:hypothetical protein
MKKKKIYSNGKLLITGEYLVLDGAKLLHYQQKKVKISSLKMENEIIWKVMMPMAVFGLKTPFYLLLFLAE